MRYFEPAVEVEVSSRRKRTFLGIADTAGAARRLAPRCLVLVVGLVAVGRVWQISLTVDRPTTSEFTAEVNPRTAVESDGQGAFSWILTRSFEIIVGNNTTESEALLLKFNVTRPPGCLSIRSLSVMNERQVVRIQPSDSDGVAVTARVLVEDESVVHVPVAVRGEPCRLGPTDTRIAFLRLDSLYVQPSNR